MCGVPLRAKLPEHDVLRPNCKKVSSRVTSGCPCLLLSRVLPSTSSPSSPNQVIVALLMGIWAGALLVSGFDPLSAFLRTFDSYVVGAFVGEGNAEVLLFTFLLGGTIGLVPRSGGALGLANALKRFMGENALFFCLRGRRYPSCHAALVPRVPC